MDFTFHPDDRVDYIGNKTFTDDKGKPLSLHGRIGTVLARVSGHESVYTVDFDGDGFIMGGNVLRLHRFTKQELENERQQLDVTIRRRLKADED
jgi:hypothetical protein